MPTIPEHQPADCSDIPSAAPSNNTRWWIAILLALATSLNYLDRQSFPVVANEIKKVIPFTNDDYGKLTSTFLLAYAIMYAGGGRIMDWLGTRWGYVIMIVWWSTANLLTGTVTALTGLYVCRFLLGIGEGGGFPGSAKAVAEWFPRNERSLAVGVFNSGSSIGAVIAPPLLALIVTLWGWRYVFYITGSIGFIWAAIWLVSYRNPLQSASQPEKTTGVSSVSITQIPSPAIGWFQLFRFPQLWVLMGAKFVTDAAWYFFIFWLPKYLGDVRGLDIKGIGYFAWIPYAVGGVGSVLGGWLSSFLLGRGFSLNVARKVALGIAASLLPVSFFIVAAPLQYAIVYFSVAMFAHQFWSANIQTLPADIFPSSVVGSVGGLLGSAGAFGGMLFGRLAGHWVQHTGYGPVFIITGLLHPLAFLLILAGLRRVAPIDSRAA